MAEDWDLHAVVRGCAATNTPDNDQSNFSDELLTNFDSLTFENDDFQSYDSGFNENLKFQGLEEVYKSFSYHQQPQLRLPYSQGTVAPVLHFPPLHSPSRPRKNQQAKVVREMTHEELQSDSWAWRKYGQKPIKGSPYPRNYYRCSTSKSCTARKQVEKSAANPDIHIVSYSGNHSHPRPTHRNSLAGTTRNKSSAVSTPIISHTMDGMSTSSRETHENDGVVMEEDEEEPPFPNDVRNKDALIGTFEEFGGDINYEDGDYSNYYTK